MYTGANGLRSSATTARALAAASPFLANGVLYTGEKIDRLVKIDVKTGDLLSDYGSSTPSPKAPGNESILLLGRTDFYIRAYDAASGAEQVRYCTYLLVVLIIILLFVCSSICHTEKSIPWASSTRKLVSRTICGILAEWGQVQRS